MICSNQIFLKKIRALSPREFENLSFDLLLLKGLQNMSWLTPGADGGRDIQGEYISYDLSENFRIEKWYVECKRYKNNVDWPTVFNKIAYAENHNADYLLLITTSFLTPQCKSELEQRKSLKKKPLIRYWDASILPKLITRYPVLLFKYGFQDDRSLESQSIFPLIRITSKAIQCAYGVASLEENHNRALEFGAALVDLISARLNETGIRGILINRRFVVERDRYSWIEINTDADLKTCDCYGVRALLATVRFYFKKNVIRLEYNRNANFEINISELQTSNQFREILNEISLWSNLEFQIIDKKLLVNTRGKI